MHVHQVEPDNSHQHPLYSLQTQYQLLLTSYFICTHSHTKQVRSNNHITVHHIRCKHNIDLYLRAIYARTPSWDRQVTSTSIIFLANTISTSTYDLFYIHTFTHKQVRSNNHITIHHIRFKHNIDFYLRSIYARRPSWARQVTSPSIVFLPNTTSAYTYGLFYARTSSWARQVTSTSIVFLANTILTYTYRLFYMHTFTHKASYVKQPHHHPSYSLQI